MPPNMNSHSITDGASTEDVAKAHAADLQTEISYDVRYLRYWVNQQHGKVFCLVESPLAETASRVHREAHGLVADKIFQVRQGV